MGLTDGLDSVIGAAKNVFSNPVGSAVGGAVAGSLITGAVIAGVTSRKKSSKKKHYKSKKRKSKRRTKKYKYARTAGKRKDSSHKRIRMTKSGQPYIILASGKARFIKKSSARASRKRKGGRY